ncbi:MULTISPECIES: RluA family pseudouridine synthase [unclassified Enterococcus]|uniref:RluA family pseudouridine synthase n=1 Tax=unclassified Enterococcus TaxID=2608891 RepID=UPI00155278A3|nr:MULTISPECIES: RluA family pseudouridine synthase [unclassified Enterococcus]MBS7576179.1 RluA family pseudouridine synthase [Enterococcus sp. MMGLQ5-2]MBS7583412.1 RluA family pseudouridine synthase [Enterococcus sp. MMGLQ5-1]NPD11272.1 RluA family pseudouridine synthase [Enterococcus sp. MMGLQ5-1]NPD36015.1 RluA family pseudouridine synthase [Enterococcus sp. MMGLQ5-2]
MKFEWIYQGDSPASLKHFLHEKGISKALLAKIKFQGGKLFVNQKIENVRFVLKKNDCIMAIIPDESAHETLISDHLPLDIIYEDEHFLLINKPAGFASIPSQFHPRGTMANFVKGYYQMQAYPNQVIHIVTRLDRETSGIMLFAKHGYAHAMLDKALRGGLVTKKYQAIVANSNQLLTCGEIIAPIGRNFASLIERQVIETGKYAHTSYQILAEYPIYSLVDIQLHTGRTHQIRVHFSYLGAPLLGDDLYGGSKALINRQALHCYSLSFYHPFLEKEMSFEIKLPEDMQILISSRSLVV